MCAELMHAHDVLSQSVMGFVLNLESPHTNNQFEGTLNFVKRPVSLYSACPFL
jgi:hypothetical protein